MPSLIPPHAQHLLSNHLLHKALANPMHMTNVHFHHDLPYNDLIPSKDISHPFEGVSDLELICGQTRSFFDIAPDHPQTFPPKDPKVHKPITITQFLQKKLRWATLGAQYDWTKKVYPQKDDPPFPPRLAGFIQGLFPNTIAEAAIVNIYSPGDTLSVHRDISEESSTGLVSLSLGCDALFVTSLGSESGEAPKPTCLRLRSGDAVYMDGLSRYTWHGVPKIIPGTCPEGLCDWPASSSGDRYDSWRGWMSSKRVNFNIRQVQNHRNTVSTLPPC